MKSRRLAMLILAVSALALGVWLRPRMVFDLWEIEAISLPALARGREIASVRAVALEGEVLPALEVRTLPPETEAGTEPAGGPERFLFHRRGGAWAILEPAESSETLSGDAVPPGSAAVADLDGDGREEWVSIAESGGGVSILSEASDGLRIDVARAWGVVALEHAHDLRFQVTALQVLDVDNDGDLDIFAGRSRIDASTAPRRDDPPRSLLFLQVGGGRFREVGGRFGDAFAKPRDVRSAAAEDFDGDGRIDVALAANGAPPIVLSSRLESRRWIRLELQPQAAGDDPASRGRSRDPASAGDPADPVDPRHPAGAGDPPDPRSPGGREDATKAADRADAADPRDPGHEASPPPSAPRRERGVVELIAGGRRQIRWFASDGTCLATGRPEMHIGLGEAASVDRIQVRWPSGSVQTWTGVAADACYLVRESEERLLER